MSWIDTLVLLLCLARFLLGGWGWQNMLAASLYIKFCKRSSSSVRELQFFTLVDAALSSCAQHSSISLCKAIGVFTLKFSKNLSSLIRCELVLWVFFWFMFNILSFSASWKENVSWRTTLQAFTGTAVDKIGLDVVEIALFQKVLKISWWYTMLNTKYQG